MPKAVPLFTWYVNRMVDVDHGSRTRGRRSLNGSGDSPQLRVRMADDLRAALTRRAGRRGVTVSELARELLTDAVQHRPENRVQLELHRTLLAKLLGDLSEIRPVVQRNLARMREAVRGDQAAAWLDEWADLIEHPGPALVDAFVATDEHNTDLRQVSPFAGLLTQDERLAAIARAGSHDVV